jgi:hypothetical protein
MAAFISMLVLLTGVPQLYAQGLARSIPGNSHVAGTMIAQNGAMHNNTGQAVLRITATVMPTVFAPQAIPKNTSSGDVLVYLPSTQQVTDVTSESHPLQDSAGAILKTTTVVSH